jgi:hypothetical protein
MTEKDRQNLFELAREFLEIGIYVNLKLQMPNGMELAKAHAQLVETAQSFFMDEVARRGLSNKLNDKEVRVIFFSAVDDYVFGKILDPITKVQLEPVKSPMKLIFGNSQTRP